MFGRLRAQTPSGGSGPLRRASAPFAAKAAQGCRRQTPAAARGYALFWRSGLRPSLVRGDTPRNAPLQNHRSPTVRLHPSKAAPPKCRPPTKPCPPPPGLDSTDETSTPFFSPCIPWKVSLQKCLKLLPQLVGGSIYIDVLLLLQICQYPTDANEPRNQKLIPIPQPSTLPPTLGSPPISDRQSPRSGWRKQPPPIVPALQPAPPPDRH